MFGRRKHTRTTEPPGLQPTHWLYRCSIQRQGHRRYDWTAQAIPFHGVRQGTPLTLASGWEFSRKDALAAAKDVVQNDRHQNKRPERKEWVTL